MKIVKFLLVPFLLFAQSNNELTIRLLQDKRAEHSPELISFLRSSSERERELALLALANIQDSTSLGSILPLLNDEHPAVRTMAAFALGMIGKASSASSLFRRLYIETDDRCVQEIFTAIGMCGTPVDLRQLIVTARRSPQRWNSSIAAGVMRFANRKIKDTVATEYLCSLLSDSESVENATYALLRINDSTRIKKYADRIITQVNDPSPSIRMWSIPMAGIVKNDEGQSVLRAAARNDRDWRVRVQAVRAMKDHPAMKGEVLHLMEDENEHVALTSVLTYDAMTLKETLFSDSSALVSILSSESAFTSVRDEVRKVIAGKIGERALPLLGQWQTNDPYGSARRIKAYGNTLSLNALPVITEAMRNSTFSIVVIAALESYHEIAIRSNDAVKTEYLHNAVELLGKNDAGISYSVALAFQDTSVDKYLRRQYLPAFDSAYQRMNINSDLEPMVEIMNVYSLIGDSSSLSVIESGLSDQNTVLRSAAETAYKAITGKNSPIRFIKNPDDYSPFYQPDDLNLLLQYTGAVIATTKGTLTIRFEKEAAPFTVLNFILLAKKRFYDNLPFHRVVSNFVIQGGDPLGNGSGGPKYTIRTEVHPRSTYKAGSVGMASAGKDTEGSQWFVTHCPTPHLDYRYTIFGYTEDSAVVDAIMVGDRIISVNLF